MNKAAKAYFATKITTTDQGDLLIMLYDAAIKFLNRAKVKIKEKDYAAKGIAISKAMDIINELTSSLNKEKGGEISNNLCDLYFYCSTKLLKANLKMDIEMLDEVITILTGLRSAFAEIVPQFSGKLPKIQAGSAPSTMPSTGAPTNMGGLKKPAMASLKSYAQNQKVGNPGPQTTAPAPHAPQPKVPSGHQDPAIQQPVPQQSAPTPAAAATAQQPAPPVQQKQTPQPKAPVQLNAVKQQNRMAANAYKQKVVNAYNSGS